MLISSSNRHLTTISLSLVFSILFHPLVTLIEHSWVTSRKHRRNICGKGYWHLRDANIEVEFFPHELAKQIEDLNTSFIQTYRSHRPFNTFFEDFIQRHKSPTIAPFPGCGFGDSLEIQPSPNLREGWQMSQVELYNDDLDPFVLPTEYQEPFKSYYATNYDRKRFVDDGEKFMLAINPISFEEAPTLQLRTRPTQYSKQHSYREVIAKDPAKQKALIKDLVTGSLKAGFANSCSLHMIVVTKDRKILLTERSQKVGVYPGSWSCSVEEDLQRRDINEGPKSAVLVWGRRLLYEELKLEADAYHTDNLRLLSVFLESEGLNISFCAHAEIKLDSRELDSILQVRRGDIEFSDWAFLDLDRIELLREMVHPVRRTYHPSSGYRILMTFLKQFGEPTESEIMGL